MAGKDAAIQRFLVSNDMAVLEAPIVFDKNESFNNYQCCNAHIMCWASLCFTPCLYPVWTFCPCVMFKYFNVQLERDSVKASWASNDCCCHKAITQKTVPLEKIQDVELTESCLQTRFGLKSVNIQTAGQGSEGPEVALEYLADPALARNVLQHAVKLYRARTDAAPNQVVMSRAGEGGAGSLGQLLQMLDQLVARGVLDKQEAGALRVPVMVKEEHQGLVRLTQAADLRDARVITDDELWHVKKGVMAHMMAP